MPKTFTTFFGTSFHGLFVDWNNDPDAAGDVDELKITFNANLYAAGIAAGDLASQVDPFLITYDTTSLVID